MFGIRVNGGTGAGIKWRPERGVRCVGCGGFISQANLANGYTHCARCSRASIEEWGERLSEARGDRQQYESVWLENLRQAAA